MKILLRLPFAWRVFRAALFSRPVKGTYWEALSALSGKKGVAVDIVHVNRMTGEVTVAITMIEMPSRRVLDKLGPFKLKENDQVRKSIVVPLDIAVELDIKDFVKAWNAEAQAS